MKTKMLEKWNKFVRVWTGAKKKLLWKKKIIFKTLLQGKDKCVTAIWEGVQI